MWTFIQKRKMSDLKAEQHTVGDAERRVWHCESDMRRGLGFPRQDERARYVVHLLSHIRRFATPWTAAQQASLSFVISQNLLKLMFVDLVMPSNILSSAVPFSSCLQSFSASGSFLMSLCIRWPKYWNFSFSSSPSNEDSELIPFRIDWFDLFAVQGTLKSLIKHHSSKASILWHPAFFIVQRSHYTWLLEKP